MPSLATLISQVREMCGGPDTTEISDTVISNALTVHGLDWLNARRPGEALSSLTTVEDQQDYNSKPSNAFRVNRVWWMDSDFEWFSPSMKYLPGESDLNFQLAGFSVLNNPALVESFYKAMEAYKGNFKGTGYETEEGKIRLEPVPGEDGDTVYFQYTYPRWSSCADVVAEYVAGLRFKAAEQVLRTMSLKRGMIRSGKNFTGGGGENENRTADLYFERAEAEVPVSYAIIDRM